MRLFIELSLISFRRQLAYRVAALAGLATNLFFGILRASVLVALYGIRQEVAGISVQGAVTFTGLSQATIGFLSLFSWYDLINSIYTGSVSTDLLKPMGYYQYWLAQDFGRAMAQLFMRGLPLMIAYAFWFDISLPENGYRWLALIGAILLAWLVSFSWRFLVNLTSFWVPNALGIARFAFIISWFLSGFMMPLRYFPDWFRAICSLTPFPYTINTIIEVYLGVLTGKDLILALFYQGVWATLLFVIGQWVLRRGIHRLEILGG